MSRKSKGVIALAAIVATAFTVNAGSAAAEMSYKDKTIKIVIPYGPGGTYDKYGQSFARFIGKYVPGNPTVIVQHMPGAGGAKAMNWAYNVMPRDGYNVITPLDNSVLNQLMRPKKMRYDARNFTWLGSSNQTNMVMVARTDSGVNKWQDMRNTPLVGSTTGPNSMGFIMPMLIKSLLGVKLRMVSGYKGSSKVIFAVERGESQFAASNWLAWSSKVPHWFRGEKKFAQPILQMGIFRDPDLPQDIPMLGNLVKDAADKKVVRFISVMGLLGRGLALPPKTSKESVGILRAAYDKMNADKAFEAELKKRLLRLMPSTGAQIQKIVKEAVESATPEVVSRARKLIYGGKS